MSSSSEEENPYSYKNIVNSYNSLKQKQQVTCENNSEIKNDACVEELFPLSSDEEETFCRTTRSRTRNAKSKAKEANRHIGNTDINNKSEVSTKIAALKQLNESSVIELDTSDSEDLEVEELIKCIWCANFRNVHRFTLKKKDALEPIFKHFSKTQHVPVNEIAIYLGTRNLTVYDTVESLKLRVTDILEAGYVTKLTCSANLNEEDKSYKMEIKCLMKDRKKPLVFFMYAKQPVEALYSMCANEIKCSVNKVLIKLDGEIINSHETPETLGLESGDCLDLVVKS